MKRNQVNIRGNLCTTSERRDVSYMRYCRHILWCRATCRGDGMLVGLRHEECIPAGCVEGQEGRKSGYREVWRHFLSDGSVYDECNQSVRPAAAMELGPRLQWSVSPFAICSHCLVSIRLATTTKWRCEDRREHHYINFGVMLSFRARLFLW